MHSLFRLWVVSLLVGNLGAAQESSSAAADAAWREFQAARERDFPAQIQQMKPSEQATVLDGMQRAVAERGWAFYRDFPQDPRRWDAALAVVLSHPSFITGFKPGYDSAPGQEGLIVDESAKKEWQARVDAIERVLDEPASGAPEAVLEERARIRLNGDVLRFAGGKSQLSWTELAPRIEAFAARFPNSKHARGFEAMFLYGLMAADRAAAEARLRRLQDESPSDAVRQLARERLRNLEMLKHPFELAFTAVDGRQVDLKQLRGKVVLVDFWATWCGPCIAELPNLKRVYAAYHDKGFEVVGIALENATLAASDAPETTASKLAKARKVLTDFTAKEEMPWPQYFDGRHWKSQPAVTYGVNAIPAMFLVDQNGMVVTTSARGPKLEAEVKRLLGIQ